MGYTGFVGKSVLKFLEQDNEIHSNIYLVHRLSKFQDLKTYKFSPSLKLASPQWVTQSEFCNSELTIINCASSRNTNDYNNSKEGNYSYPKTVISSILKIRDVRLTWIQLDSIWKYSKDSTPNDSYVYWKNRFAELLLELNAGYQFNLKTLTLPHLIGPYDNLGRLFPRYFIRILKNYDIRVEAGEDNFYFADVRDVAQHLTSCYITHMIGDSITQSIFPFYKMTFHQILADFISSTQSKSRLLALTSLKSINPQIPFLDNLPSSSFVPTMLRPTETSLIDVARWLSSLDSIDKLDL